MAEPETYVAITDTEFTVGELQEFLDTVRGVDAMPANALIAVRHQIRTISNSPVYTLTASTAYRSKED